jgi:hypothetical protein
MVSTSEDQEQMWVTGITKDVATGKIKLFVDRGENEEPKDLRWHDPSKPFTCSETFFPRFAPPKWSCDPNYYWNQDGCHCDCGAYDPDCCISLGADTFNCRAGEECSRAGTCVFEVVDLLDDKKEADVPFSGYISEPCELLSFTGEVSLTGYVGTEEKFKAETRGICSACVDDQFYDGTPQLSIESKL